MANSTPTRPASAIELVVVHHSAANDEHTDLKELMAERQHRNEGYNAIVDDDAGNLDPRKRRDGIAEWVQDAPDMVISNGTYGVNAKAWNICIDGNFELNDPTPDEVETLIQVIAAKVRSWGWTKADVWRIIGHRDAGAKYSRTPYVTACPGRNLYKLLPYIRQRVAAYLPA